MNILTDELPEAIEIGGVEYKINADFRTCMRIMADFESQELTDHEKVYLMIRNLFIDPPENFAEAVRLAMLFLNCGETAEASEAIEHDGFAEAAQNEKYYSFRKDAGLIYAAFRQVYGINLSRDALHWWEFAALFAGMGGDTAFSNLVSLRKRVADGKATKEEIETANEMGDAFYVDDPEPPTIEEQRNRDKFFEALDG